MRPNSSFVLNSTSFPLRESLVRLNLCSERDFRRCRRHVRRLARGIPVFDFVWIDCAVARGRAHAFPGESPGDVSGRSAPLGSLCALGSNGPRRIFRDLFGPDTWRIRSRRAEARCGPPADEIGPAFDRLRALIERLRGLDNPFVIGPHFVDQHGSELIIRSRHGVGPICREFLIRRGRYPVDVVGPIAR